MIPTARIERAQFHRARSASKEGTWPLLPHPSEAAPCASKGIVPATSFRISLTESLRIASTLIGTGRSSGECEQSCSRAFLTDGVLITI